MEAWRAGRREPPGSFECSDAMELPGANASPLTDVYGKGDCPLKEKGAVPFFAQAREDRASDLLQARFSRLLAWPH
jgi:hypothetical protein